MVPSNPVKLGGVSTSVGFSNTFSFNGVVGLEANLLFGFNCSFFLIPNNNNYIVGYIVNPELKFRYKKLGIGFYTKYTEGSNLSNDFSSANIIFGITVGQYKEFKRKGR